MSKVVRKPALTKNVQPRMAANGYRLPDPLPPGEVLVDNTKNTWILGESIGVGGFGEIYTAKSGSSEGDGYDYVIKVDHNTGPLFSEMHFYHRVAKSEAIKEWMSQKDLNFLGMPIFVASGIHDKQSNLAKVKSSRTTKPKESLKYRFLVMPRFGTDLQVMLNLHHKFTIKTTYTIAIKILDILEYIHSYGYTHGDIKASNLLLSRQEELKSKGRKTATFSKIYLVDFGLVERYIFKGDGVHKKFEEDARRANNGTVEFTSRDGHIGAFSRKSDLEVLAYNMLSWMSGGRLPWMTNLKNLNFVKDCKRYYMEKITELLNFCFPAVVDDSPEVAVPSTNGYKKDSSVKVDRTKPSPNIPPGIADFIKYIVKLQFEEEPDYAFLKSILEKAIIKSGEKTDGKFCFQPTSNGYKRPTPSPCSSPIPIRSRTRRKI